MSVARTSPRRRRDHRSTSRARRARPTSAPRAARAAQEAIRRFLNKLPGQYRVGLVTFSTEAYVASPLTRDRKLVLAAVDSMYTGRGTALGDGLARSVELVQTAPNPEDAPAAATATPPDPDHPLSAILLLSDGAQTTGLLEPRTRPSVPVLRHPGLHDRPRHAGRLRRRRRWRLRRGLRRRGSGGFRRPVPPDPATLAQIAEITGGEAFETTSDARLNEVYEDMASRFGKKTEWREATSLFLGAAALCWRSPEGCSRCSGASACREGRGGPSRCLLLGVCARGGRLRRVGEDGGDRRPRRR